MKIACISTSSVPANTANSIQVMKVCQALAQLGNEVSLWVPGKSHIPWQELSAFYGLNTPFTVNWLFSSPRLKRYDFSVAAFQKAAKWQAEVIYTWVPQTALLGLLRGYPVVLEVHDRPMGKMGPHLLAWLTKIKGQKRLAVITQALAQALEHEFHLELNEEILVISPNGADLERYTNLPDPESARRNLNLTQSFTAVYAGHLYPGRGMDLLVGLAKALPDIEFLWVGGQPQTVFEWRDKIQALGLKNVTLTGFVENQQLPLYQASGEVLLMPYGLRVEGSSGGNSADICSPMKMFEYLACGRVIISSDLPVLHEILNKQNAVFCGPEDVATWISVMRSLKEDPNARAALGKQALLDAQKYTWQKRQEKILGNWM